MSAKEFQSTIINLVTSGKFKVSEHGLDALFDDDLGRVDVADSITESEIVENYPEFGKGPAILLYQVATDGGQD